MTAPLTPTDCDLRDFQFMPLDIVRLFGSRFHAVANDPEWRAGVTLWLKSFHQVPAGSVPNDDVELCRLAELGRDMRTWKKVREHALHGWVLCDDGRYYHPVVCEKATEAWAKRISYRERGRKGNEKRWNGSGRQDEQEGSAPTGDRDEGREGTIPATAKGSQADRLAIAPASQGTGTGTGTGIQRELTLSVIDGPSPIREADFEIWWAFYPKKVGKIAASKAYDKARRGKAKPGAETLLGAVKRAPWPAEARFIPNPATWLNEGRWMDSALPLDLAQPKRVGFV